MLLQSSATVVANTTTDDVLVNNVLASNFRRPYIVQYALVASATGLQADLKVGMNLVAQNVLPSLLNRFPVYPDDFGGSFGVLPGDRIILTVRNTTGGNLTIFFAFRFRPA